MNIKQAFGKVRFCADPNIGIVINGCEIIAVNNEVQATAVFDHGSDLPDRRIVVSSTICNLLNLLPGDPKLSMKNGKLFVSHASGKHMFNGMGDVPFAQVVDNVGSIVVQGRELAKAMAFVGAAMGANDVRYYLNGTHVVLKDGAVVVEATNGFSLARTTLHAESLPPDTGVDFIVPFRTAREIAKEAFLHESVSINVGSAGMVEFNFGDFSVKCKTIDGQFPDTDKIVTKTPATGWIKINPAVVRRAINRTVYVDGGKQATIAMSIEDGRIALSAKGDAGGSEEYCDCETTGGGEAHFGYALIDGALSAFEQTVDIRINNEEINDPVALSSDQGVWLVMQRKI